MNSKKKKKINKILETLFDVKYVDGKPVKVKVDPLDEIRKELEPTQDANPFDAEKRELYAELPQSQLKRDRSITARALNQTLESFNKRRNEAKFSSITGFEDRWQKFMTKDWEFMWNKNAGTLKSTKKPDNGYNLEYKSQSIVGSDKISKVYKLMEDHIKRVKS